MEYDRDTDDLVFKDGKRLYANAGIIGINPHLEISHGFDARIEPSEELTPERRIELADYMIELWSAFRLAGSLPI